MIFKVADLVTWFEVNDLKRISISITRGSCASSGIIVGGFKYLDLDIISHTVYMMFGMDKDKHKECMDRLQAEVVSYSLIKNQVDPSKATATFGNEPMINLSAMSQDELDDMFVDAMKDLFGEGFADAAKKFFGGEQPAGSNTDSHNHKKTH